jgi:putative colanic acid biosynthesis acetyltransferase WcaF
MSMGRTDLSQFNNDWYQPGAGLFKRAIWHILNVWLIGSNLPGSGWKVWLLRLFRAKVGAGVVLKPGVKIRYPWRLTIGDHVWIGEGAWIDNLADVVIHNHVCISQGAMLLTGNHNYKQESFDLIVAPIELEDGVWIGARSVVCPGVTCRSHAILSVGSVATRELEAYWIYQGNPAAKRRPREIAVSQFARATQ